MSRPKGAPFPALEERAVEPRWTFDPRSFVANERSSECPAGQRTATASECLAAVRVAAVHQSAGKVKNHLRSVRVSASDGAVPSGCSFSAVTGVAIFNSHPAGGDGWLPEADYRMWLARGREVNRSAYTLVCHPGAAKPAGESRTAADGDEAAAKEEAGKEEAWAQVWDQLDKAERAAEKEAQKEREAMTETEAWKQAEEKALAKVAAREAAKQAAKEERRRREKEQKAGEQRKLADDASAKIADAEARADRSPEAREAREGREVPAHPAREAAGSRPHGVDGDSRTRDDDKVSLTLSLTLTLTPTLTLTLTLTRTRTRTRTPTLTLTRTLARPVTTTSVSGGCTYPSAARRSHAPRACTRQTPAARAALTRSCPPTPTRPPSGAW